MISINYPEPAFRLKEENGVAFIFDAIRKQWLRLTDEEWVRQNFIRYLLAPMQYPSTLIALEKEVMLGDLKKRFDILVYDRDHKPWMMIECKAPGISLDENVLQQLLRYHITVPVPYLVITNGTQTMGWAKEEGSLKMLDTLPPWV
jgi:hypothetical protein